MGKTSVRGDILVSDLVKEIWRIVGHENRHIFVVLCHSSKSSICSSFIRHSSAFSGLFQAS
jgi:hypothetical protein